MRAAPSLAACAAAVWAMPAAAAITTSTDCHALTGRTYGDARVIATEQVTPPFTIGSIAVPSGRSATAAVAFCRVTGIARPVAGSEIRFEVWLPAPAAWNGRLQGVGNGGFAGSIAYSGLTRAVGGGYAVVATDTGHVGDPSQADWAIGQPERIVDLGWRAMHVATLAAKAIVADRYGRAAVHAYYTGCSTGGRQGLALAQRFPQDYDGIVVGAPAYDWPRLLAFDAIKYTSLLKDPARWLSPAKLDLLQGASQRTCGAHDGLIDDPGACRFDPAVLACRGRDAARCLNPSELAMARLMYGGLTDGAGRTLYPGFTPGLEGRWALWNLGSAGMAGRDSLAYPYPLGFYGRLVNQDPGWTIDRFDPRTDMAKAIDGPVGAAVQAEDANLAAFFDRGGKLLHYHGWHDPAIPAQASLRYRDRVVARLGRARTDASYRLFLGTGMLHCAGGPGPDQVGGVSGDPPSRDAEHDVLEAVRAWVEGSIVPDQIIATRYRDGSRDIAAQRPWCAVPAAPVWTGGDRRFASSFTCRMPAR